MATLISRVSRMLNIQEDFDHKEKRYTEDLYPLASVRTAQMSSPLFCSTLPFILGNLENKNFKKKQIIFSTQVLLSFSVIQQLHILECCCRFGMSSH